MLVQKESSSYTIYQWGLIINPTYLQPGLQTSTQPVKCLVSSLVSVQSAVQSTVQSVSSQQSKLVTVSSQQSSQSVQSAVQSSVQSAVQSSVQSVCSRQSSQLSSKFVVSLSAANLVQIECLVSIFSQGLVRVLIHSIQCPRSHFLKSPMHDSQSVLWLLSSGSDIKGKLYDSPQCEQHSPAAVPVSSDIARSYCNKP